MSITYSPSVSKSGILIKELIEKQNPFLITRLGCAIGFTTLLFDKKQPSNTNFIYRMERDDGIYCNNTSDIKLFAEMYLEAIKNSDYLAVFPSIKPDFSDMQNYFLNKYSIQSLHNRSMEPFYNILENEIPWTHSLIGKKVLIINPFIDSMKKQLSNKFQMFKDKKLFLDGQEFIFYKTFMSLANNRPHKNWYETYEIMRDDIQKLDFDIALLGCGGYGLPLANFIYKKMNKSAIYIGGGLQLLFGIMGNRWENNTMWKKIMNESQSQFIRPSGDEIIKNKNMIENACYW
jgi:hypothetical protein